jgi:hypothetical protein
MTRKAVLSVSGSGKGGEKRLGNETSLAAYFIALPHVGHSQFTTSVAPRSLVRYTTHYRPNDAYPDLPVHLR